MQENYTKQNKFKQNMNVTSATIMLEGYTFKIEIIVFVVDKAYCCW